MTSFPPLYSLAVSASAVLCPEPLVVQEAVSRDLKLLALFAIKAAHPKPVISVSKGKGTLLEVVAGMGKKCLQHR